MAAGARSLPAGAGDLVRTVWRPAEAAGAAEVVRVRRARIFDTGTPADYLAANLHAAGGGNLVAAGRHGDRPVPGGGGRRGRGRARRRDRGGGLARRRRSGRARRLRDAVRAGTVLTVAAVPGGR